MHFRLPFTAIYSDSTSYSWAWALQEGKTYKATLAGTQGNVEVTELAESNEITRNALVPLEAPTGLAMDRGFCQWNPVNNAEEYSVAVNSESGSGIVGTSGTMKAFPDGTVYYDASRYLTAGEKYCFTVQARGDNADYSDGPVVTSEVFTYTGPKTDLPAASFSYPPSLVEYTGAEIKPAITAEGLVEGRDFAVEYTGNINVGPVDIDITGIGDYKGMVYRSFRITPFNLENAAVDLDAIQWGYSRYGIEPPVTVSTSAGVELKRGIDYTVEYSDNTSLGTGHATVTAISGGNCTGSKTVDFDIVPEDIKNIDNITLSKTAFTYTGKANKPAVTVTGLKSGTDYKVAYTNNTKVGKATVTITGTGNYTDTITKTFVINPKQAVVSKATPGKKKLTVKMGTKVTATGGATYQIAYKQKGTSKWKYTTTTKQSKVISKLKKGKRYYVKVRAYKTVSKTKYYGAWSKTKLSKKIK